MDRSPVERFFNFSLLGLVASGYLAVAGSGLLDLPTILLTAAGLVLRGLIIAGQIRLNLSQRALNAATLAYIAFYPLDYAYISRSFLEATVHLIFFLAVLRILTARTSRDYLFVKAIAFLELLAACILSSNLNFLAFLSLYLIFGVATFASAEILRSSTAVPRAVRPGKRIGWRLAGLSVTVAVGIVILSAGLFLVLPRTARAALRHFSPHRLQVSGFSNEVTLGRTGEIQQSGATVMHVRMDTGAVRTSIKWRGSALTDFDGRRWTRPAARGEIVRAQERMLLRLADDRQRSRAGRRISYEVSIAALDSDALFFAGVPEFLRIGLPFIFRSEGDSFRTGLGISDGLRYYAYSYFDPSGDVGQEALSAADRAACLRSPGVTPRVRELARQWVAGATTDRERAAGIERNLRKGFGYTLDLPEVSPSDPIDHFLFERRKGHCEYFASAMAVLLREMNIPSRVATGFQSGVYNPLTGAHLIRASDAHSWVEAYLDGRGWATFDPTPPDPRGTPSSEVWTQLTLYLDAAETVWQEWVLGYDFDRQFRLAETVERSGRQFRLRWFDAARVWTSLKRAASASAPLLSAAGLAVLAWHLWPALSGWVKQRRRIVRAARGGAYASDATLLYRRMLATLKRRGFDKPAWLTPAEFAQVLPASAWTIIVEEITRAYNEVRFGGKPEAAARMARLLRELENAQ